jgi:hypothetical protein
MNTQPSMTGPTDKKAPLRRGWRIFWVALALWIGTDFLVPVQHSIRAFDAAAVAEKDSEMWQSYYRKERLTLFYQLADALRDQFGAPMWRSWGLAWWAAKAAFDFKNGTSRADYEKALPTLETYFAGIRALSVEPFDTKKAARAELDWWIVHRERGQHSPGALANALAQAASVLYNQPPTDFVDYARHRAEAMRIRDDTAIQPGGTTPAHWTAIRQQLDSSWAELHRAVNQPGRVARKTMP